MDSRFASVVPDNDPRYPGMIVATIRETRDLAAFPIGAQHTHDGVAMKVVGRDPNVGTVRLRPIPGAPPRPSGPVHLAMGFADDERTCAGEGGALTTNVGEVECAACLAAALAEAERLAAEYTARLAALKGPA